MITMSKRTGDRAKFNREHKKRMQRRKRGQELRQTLEAKNSESEALASVVNDGQPAKSRLRQVTGDPKADLKAFEIVVYKSLP